MSSKSELTYKRKVLSGNDQFEIVSCEWNEKSVSLQHSHGWSQCVVLIEEGRFENRSDFGHSVVTKVFEKGSVIATPLGVEHEIRCLSSFGKTLHVYIPRISKNLATTRLLARPVCDLQALPSFSLNESGTSFEHVIAAMDEIQENSISTSNPFFMNQLFSGIFPETLLADARISQMRTTLATFESGPALTAIELILVNKLGEQIGWPENSREGISVPGGSAANFMAVHCARQKKYPESRIDGNGPHRFHIFTSKASHYSLKKACLALGLGLSALKIIECDAEDRMIPSKLEAAIRESVSKGFAPLMVCATAGTTVRGSFDSIGPLADICQNMNLWLHVDGAWGGPALFSTKLRPLLAGIDRADSMTFDAHKLCGSSLTASFFLTRHKEALLDANDVAGGDYIFHSDEVIQDRGRLSWQCGRNADFLSFWALWKHLGANGIGQFIDQLVQIKEEAIAWIRTQDRLELIGRSEFLNVCVRVKSPSGQDPDWSRRVREKLKSNNQALVNFANEENGPFLRLIFVNPRLKLTHVQQILSWAMEV